MPSAAEPRRRMRVLGALAVVTLACLLGTRAAAPSFWSRLDRIQYDASFRHVAPAPSLSPSLVLFTIDDLTLRTLGAYPVPRSAHAELLDGLTSVGAKGTSWDLLFDRATADDEAFARAMERIPTVLAVGAKRPSGPVRPPTAAVTAALDRFSVGPPFAARPGSVVALEPTVLSEERILEAAAGGGHVAATVDEDGVCRRVPLVAEIDGRLVPSLGLAMAMQALDVPREDVELSPGAVVVGGRTLADPIRIPVDGRGRAFVNYVREWDRTLDHRSYVTQLESLEAFPEDLEEGLRDRTVLVGFVASGSGDFVAAPHEAHLPGVLVSYGVANMVLTRAFLRPSAPWIPWLLAVLLPLAVLAVYASGRPGLVALAVLAATLALAAAGILLFSRQVFLPVGFPLVATLVVAGVLATTSHALEYARASRVSGMLARFVSPALLRELETAGGRLPKARRLELTVLFVDIAGFTPFTEEQEPEVVSEFLDGFYGMAMEELFRHGGTLDEFKGDGVLAYFGAPEPLERKEEAAVRAAVAIRERFSVMDRERTARGGVPLAIRCGITTGFVAVGYFGGRVHATYGVVGRAVNLAARIQGSAEEGEVVVDKATAARIEGRIETASLPAVQLKGIAKPVEIWRIAAESRGAAETGFTRTGA